MLPCNLISVPYFWYSKIFFKWLKPLKINKFSQLCISNDNNAYKNCSKKTFTKIY